MDESHASEVFHSPGHLNTDIQQPLLSRHLVMCDNNNVVHANTSWRQQTSYHFSHLQQCGWFQYQLIPLFPEVGQQAAMGHEWHDYVRGWASIQTHPYQLEDIGVIKLVHLCALLEEIFHKVFFDKAYKKC